MLGPGRYLLGVAEILLLAGFAWLGGAALRRWLLPRFEGAPAGLATTVLALALLIWPAELLGSFSAWDPVPYLVLVAAVGLGLWKFAPRPPEGGYSHLYLLGGVGIPSLWRDERLRRTLIATVVALAIAVVAVIHFAGGVKTRLSTGMTGFDSTWYHGPFAAGFFQSGDTWSLHFIAPQFLAWFYPANGEIFHAVGMLAFSRDVLSPLLNLSWFVGCLVACWCIGRPYRVAPWSLVLGAVALSVPALADQAGEARNDIVGIFFLLAAVAIALNGERDTRTTLVAGLAAGLAAGTKLNFLLPAAVLVIGLALISPRETRWRTFAASALAALAGAGYWYLRNLIHTGNPLPWIHHLGPINLAAPQQALGGREAHSVLSYLTNGSVWSNWFLPGLHQALWLLWPILLAAALAGLILCVAQPLAPLRRRRDENRLHRPEIVPSAGVLGMAGLVGLASALAWLVAPTSASGPDGTPRGFESGLRYLAPALILGLALLPAVLPPRLRLAGMGYPSSGRILKSPSQKARRLSERGVPHPGLAALVVLVAAVVIGYPIQRHYLESRYKDPTFTTPGLNAAFAWARNVSDARIATTSTRQYPLFGTDLSNHVQYLGLERPHGGFEAPQTCPQYRHLLDEGDYDYVIATRDRIEPGKPPYPPAAKWTEGPGAHVILRKPPTVVFKLSGRLDPSACR
ncbi:MAG TPA: hypothetical protein VFJ65_05290 [Solirubrobacterales bacterium]|nr:hypothetical protein [Solirubrobacterales bacterium]